MMRKRVWMVAALLVTLGRGLPGQEAPQLPCSDCCPNPPCDGPPPLDRPLRVTMYYPWWDGVAVQNGNCIPRPKWSDDNTTWDPDDGKAHYHPDFDANGVFHKCVDLYNDNDPATVRTQLQRMAAAAINVLVASWWGPWTPEAGKFRDPIRQAALQVPSVKVTTLFETYGMVKEEDYKKCKLFRDQDGQSLQDCMKLWLDEMVTWSQGDLSRRFLKFSQRPVLFVYEPGNTSCQRLAQWKQALDWVYSRKGVRPFLVVDMANDIQSRCSNWSLSDFAFFEYAPGSPSNINYYAEMVAGGQRQTQTLWPGYWPRGTVCDVPEPPACPLVPRLSPSSWQRLVNYANTRRPTYFQIITSWNEWNEMTSVEPMTKFPSPSGLGQYLDVLAQFPLY
ncbi:MAG: hypothetical protein ACP5NF_08685 [Thermoanaerobaculum sp.]